MKFKSLAYNVLNNQIPISYPEREKKTGHNEMYRRLNTNLLNIF